MYICERLRATGIDRTKLILIGEASRRVVSLTVVFATVCLLGSACTPISDSPTPSGQPAISKGKSAPGRSYADAACASCHAVAAGQTRSPNPNAPTFETIANVPGMTLMALNVALHTSHKTMPNLIIEPDRIEDLAAYLHTLKR
ncbi:MAG: hypothetical protein ABMA14_23650 [Hyphomonadaceae bacterium]